MSLGIITSTAANGQEGSNVICKLISMVGDDGYLAGGTAGFQQSVRDAFAADGQGALTVIAVVPQDCGLHVPSYDKANDKLKVVLASTGIEVANADYSAITYNMLVICE
jgi:hypothetical protein